MGKRLLSPTETACELGISIQTLNSYYKFKKENPENEVAMELPDFIRVGNKKARYWRAEDIEAIRKFRENIPTGRNGILGSVTQRYYHTSKNEERKAKGIIPKTYIKEPKTAYISKIELMLKDNDVEDVVIDEVIEILKSELEWRKPQAV